MHSPFAVFVSRIGPPEVLEPRAITIPMPKPDEVIIEHTAVAVNFVDIYLRAGQPHSHNPEPPFIPGVSGVGRIVAMGDEVKDLSIGQTVTYTNAGVGTYSTHVAVRAIRIMVVPEGLDDIRVAAGLVRALTAQYLLKQMRPLSAGTRILVHAAAGGVGQILVQWAKRLGLVVIGTAGSDEKTALAKSLGADHVINYRTQDFVKEVDAFTAGKGVSVVFDSVGKDTFEGSVDCLEPKGLVVNYGTASGQVENFALQRLHAKSLWVCRPTLKTYTGDRDNILVMAKDAFELLADPTVRLDVEAVLPLSQAAKSHEMLESRQTKGAIVLVPDDLLSSDLAA
ncbi:MAG: quinone oxidoreductase [Orrella sp.]